MVVGALQRAAINKGQHSMNATEEYTMLRQFIPEFGWAEPAALVASKIVLIGPVVVEEPEHYVARATRRKVSLWETISLTFPDQTGRAEAVRVFDAEAGGRFLFRADMDISFYSGDVLYLLFTAENA